MDDVADGLLLDVRELSIADLEFTSADSALGRALERILAPGEHSSSSGGGNGGGFNNFIS